MDTNRSSLLQSLTTIIADYRHNEITPISSEHEEKAMELETSKTYRRSECAVFLRTAEQFGGLSNMAGGYALSINGIRILTSEALYQACRFPHRPDIQKLILGQTSPMAAKMKSKPYRKDSRPDWDAIRVGIMRWCLHVKLVQNWEKFGCLLLSTGNMPIVEESYRDPFWGAKPVNEESLVGQNVLGQLLAKLREQLKNPESHTLWVVEPLPISQFLLINKPIGFIENAKARLQTVSESTNSYLGLWQQAMTDGDNEPISTCRSNESATEKDISSSESILDLSNHEIDGVERLEISASPEFVEINQQSLPLEKSGAIDKTPEPDKKAEIPKNKPRAKSSGRKHQSMQQQLYMQL